MSDPAKRKLKTSQPTEQGRRAWRLKEVSAMVGIPVSTLRTMVRKGELNPIVGFHVWLIGADELDRLLQHRLRPNAITTPRSPAPAGKLGDQRRKVRVPIQAGFDDEPGDANHMPPPP